MPPLLEIQQLTINNCMSEQKVIDQLNVTIDQNEIVALVGASGSGKSLLAQAILHLLPNTLEQTGEIFFKGKLVTAESVQRLRGQSIVMIPQSVEALDPLMRVGKQMMTLVKGKNKEEKLAQTIDRLGLEATMMKKYPFELSGGQARRVLVAIALLSEAPFVIADEPTPGLDVKARKDMLDLLKSLSVQDQGMLLITHDIYSALHIADRIAVLNQGGIVEIAPVEAFRGCGEELKHAYTRSLWRSLPENQFIDSLINRRSRR